ncbi:hypothetical protein K491DRAFT_618434 [Lophiostoma macrostomum CBS 122681]|uniref:Uncharacterized protein n=1 Tax=Lophiostoma macrostomum CBS 122681 TaxID=1314788 RepID=A0A6A6TQD1_9PLEO|nr:hypothetical protein K491DRAFT_618434 [Lophiostoma macrostomum CBS 122681]
MLSPILFLCCSSTVVMIFAFVLQLLLGLERVVSTSAEPPFNNPPGVDIWCGKAYRPTNSSFDPGGWLSPPPEGSNLLDLRVRPRHSFYLSSETKASFIVDTVVNGKYGTPYKNETWDNAKSNGTSVPFTEMDLQIRDATNQEILLPATRIPINATNIEIEFDLQKTRYPWTIWAFGASPEGLQTYHKILHINVLPERNDTGSVARIDSLYGGIQTKSSLTGNTWKTIFPYSFYTSWDWIASTINNASATTNLQTFRDSGFNIIHPIPPGGTDPFNHTLFSEFLALCDELELYVMYDMRHTYQNQSSIATQLSYLQSHPSLLLYYTADEPDGWCDPLNATHLSNDYIKSLDPYHPVSLVLNCANFYFDEYTSGADIILEDTYPIAANTTFSPVYNTPCNATYGDCGCDDCHANDPAYPAYVHNPFLDISDRVDNFYTYQNWLGRAAEKPVWGVPQAFWDQGSFWERWPTPAEEAVMSVLRVNHGAKGIVSWDYPTNETLEGTFSALATVLTHENVTAYTLGAKRYGSLVTNGGDGLVDATAWVDGNGVLVGLVYQGYEAVSGKVEVKLPVSAIQADTFLFYGATGWEIGADGKTLVKSGLEALEVTVLKIGWT